MTAERTFMLAKKVIVYGKGGSLNRSRTRSRKKYFNIYIY